MTFAESAKVMREYLVGVAPVVALVVDEAGRILEANAHATALLGDDLVGRPISGYVVDLDGSFRPERLAREGGVRLVDLVARGGDSETHRVTCIDDGGTFLVLGAIDLAEQTHLRAEVVALNAELGNVARELARKNAELARLNELKNRFLGMAAHDLRKPVSTVLSYAEFLMDETKDRLTAEQQRFLRIIHDSCWFMSSLIDDFLDVAVIESGHLTLHRAPSEPASIIAASMVVAELAARRKGVSLVVDSPPLPKLRVDAPKLEQVLNNLVTNAIDHSSPGATVDVSSSMREGAWVIVVRDHGTGIDPTDLARMFEPFQRGSVTKTAGERSTGLGLAIAKKIVEEHGGTIAAENTAPSGAAFTVRIPAGSGASR